MKNVINLYPYEVFEFPWGSAIKKRNGKWEKIFLKPTGQEIDVSNIEVTIHQNGIEFM